MWNELLSFILFSVDGDDSINTFLILLQQKRLHV